MTIPAHTNPTIEIARAPYNFVPLPEHIVTIDPGALPDQDRYHPDRHTGYVECVITTETPIYIRAPLTPDEFAEQEAGLDEKKPWRQQVRNKPDFFYADPAKTPRIPGSSLRGMVRQLVEIVSYSKVQWVSDQPLVYRAVGDTTSHGNHYRSRIMREDGRKSNRAGKQALHYTPKVRAGYIVAHPGGEFAIRPAQEIGGTTFARIRIDGIPAGLQLIKGCKNARAIWFQTGPYEYQHVRGGFLCIKYAKVIRAAAQPTQGMIKGALVSSGPMASKKTEAVIYPPDEQAELIKIPHHLVTAYLDQVSQEQEAILGDRNGVLRDGQPVFYLMEQDKLVFFGHTMMMRLPYLKTPLDFVPEDLRRESDLDLAEAIFGYTKSTGEGKARAYASRVFVSDSILEPGQTDIWLQSEPIVPKILASPKPTTFQHYLVQQKPDLQPQGTDRSGKPVKELSDYADQRATVIRGHKLYWHKGQVTMSDLQEALDRLRDERGRENERDTQHTQIKPVRAGARFRCRIFFENLSDEELGALLWALTLPGPKTYRHSIGMGKPLGMGAIKIDASLVLEDRQQRYQSLFAQETWETGHRQADDQIGDYIAAFDQFIRSQIGATNRASLADVPRIQMLLRMLEWPGPDKEQTRYMEIERKDPTIRGGKINEYKNRPVLPDPLHVDISNRVKESTAKPVAHGKVDIDRPASPDEVQTGMYLEGVIKRIEKDRLVVDILGAEASLTRQRLDPPARDLADMEERFKVGKTIRAWVYGRNKQGRLQLTMRREEIA